MESRAAKYAAGLYDPQTGLVRFGARGYDPYAGRWLAKDPIGFGGGAGNLYADVGNDPVNWIDLDGLQVTLLLEGARGTMIKDQNQSSIKQKNILIGHLNE